MGATSVTGGWDVAVSADTTNGALILQVTGDASFAVRWVARVKLTEVIGASA